MYVYVCFTYFILTQFLFPFKNESPLLAIMIKVEIKTKLSSHFLKEVSPNIPF